MAVHTAVRTARLFADDCIVYRPIRNNDDTILLQNDLNIAEWEFMWQMQFNLLLNLRSSRDYVGSSIPPFVRACGTS